MVLTFALLVVTSGDIDLVCADDSEKTKPQAATQSDHGFLVSELTSEYQSPGTQVRVLLPDHLDAAKRYRVLFVLPVEAANGVRWGDGLLEVKRANLHNQHQLICVAPTFSDLPWYADHPVDPRIRQESHLLNIVVPFIDGRYPTLPESRGRLLVGFSKSGWGAFSLLMRHPDMFSRAAAWDAPLMMSGPNKYGMGPIFGSQANFEKYQLSRLLHGCAKRFQAESQLFHFGYGSFRTHHEQMETLMSELGVSHVYRDGPAREHSWSSGWLPGAVRLLATDDSP